LKEDEAFFGYFFFQSILTALAPLLKDDCASQSFFAGTDLDLTELLDSMRRQSGGLTEHALDDQRRALTQLDRSPYMKQVRRDLLSLQLKAVVKSTSVTTLRNIAHALIEANANINAEENPPILGHTPLILAAEIDERDLFELMLLHERDIEKTYLDPKSNRSLTTEEIAKSFGSTNILAAILSKTKNKYLREVDSQGP
jgi:hypothetical protein